MASSGETALLRSPVTFGAEFGIVAGGKEPCGSCGCGGFGTFQSCEVPCPGVARFGAAGKPPLVPGGYAPYCRVEFAGNWLCGGEDGSTAPKKTRTKRAARPEMPQDELTRLIQTLEDEMHEAAKELRFEYAARLRDEVNDLRKELKAMRTAGVGA